MIDVKEIIAFDDANRIKFVDETDRPRNQSLAQFEFDDTPENKKTQEYI
jgi:hypothetical protein